MSVNKITLLGNVGSDPDVRTLPSGAKVANFTLATSERGYTAQNGTQVPERTEWHNITCWNGPASIVEAYVRKGSKLYLEGKLRYRQYEDKNGVKRTVAEIHLESIELLDGRRQNTQGATGSAPATPYATSPDPGVKDDLPF